MPEAVLKRAAEEMLDYGGSGMSVMEMSHRGKHYNKIITDVEESLREVLSIPENYKVLFIQGGATLQFSMVAMNLLGRTGKADYAVTGRFSSNAFNEGKKFGSVRTCCDTSDINHTKIPAQNGLFLDAGASYMHYCMNNTIFGTLWPYIPETSSVPLVCDMSSCILSEPVDVSRFGLIYAGAQKNMGPAGFAIVILREDILAPLPVVPAYMDYAIHIKNESMYNTPPTYGIYILGLVLDWIKGLGGLGTIKTLNEKKSAVLYKTLDESSLFHTKADKSCRSLMNVVFSTGSDELDDKFVKSAAAEGMLTLKNHRSANGLRASIYNAMPMEGVEKLVEFIRKFERENI